MDLICYLHPGWEPLIRPAEPTRDWMTAAPESFAYRCLPLNIANAHGWEVLCPCAFDARWSGGIGTDQVDIRLAPGSKSDMAPVSLFGQGVLTFHIAGLFRTPPGWNLWVGGSPNRPKEGIYPLAGVVETDWAPYTFTMNWRFLRRNHWVHFEAGEPICFFYPIQRGYLEGVAPRFVPMEAAPEVLEQFKTWSRSRDEFHARIAREPSKDTSQTWQKHYYRGVVPSGAHGPADHQTKLRLAEFAVADAPPEPAAPAVAAKPVPDVLQAATADHRDGLALRKRDWLLDAMERHRELSPAAVPIERRFELSREEFLESYYAPGRPVILAGEMEGWPARSQWTPRYLRETIGSAVVEYQGGRSTDERFEMYKNAHRRELPFEEFIDLIVGTPGNDAYMTAYNSERNRDALSVLHRDLGFLDKFLSRDANAPHGMMWIGPAGTTTSLHHDLTDNLIAQIVGSKELKLIPAADIGKIYNHVHVFSEITDLDDPKLDPSRFPLLSQARIYDLTLAAGEILFVPLGWWHQVKALDFSVTITYTNFLWPNDSYRTYPTEA